MVEYRTRMADGGRLVVPVELRRQLGLQTGDSVVLDLADGELRVRPLAAGVKRAQALVRRFVPEGANLADALLKERRDAARRE
jgi:AbrB family looped-hinge helix DNA binding protein